MSDGATAADSPGATGSDEPGSPAIDPATDPATGSEALAKALEMLADADRLLIALDFDGTLAPFVDVPGSARALPRSTEAVRRLERIPNTWVAFVSGRPLQSLELVTEADENALLIGSHGVEVRFGADGEDLDLTPVERERLTQLGPLLEELAAANPGVRLERKPVGFGVHTRLLPADRAQAVNRAAYRAAASVSGELTIRDGKDILEFSVRNADKGDGIVRLKQHVHADTVLFAGDDVTDEDGFAVLGASDVGIKVGAGDSLARYRVPDPEAIAEFLTSLAAEREAATASRFS